MTGSFTLSIIARMFAFIYKSVGDFWGALEKDSHELQIPDCSGTGLDERAVGTWERAHVSTFQRHTLSSRAQLRKLSLRDLARLWPQAQRRNPQL